MGAGGARGSVERAMRAAFQTDRRFLWAALACVAFVVLGSGGQGRPPLTVPIASAGGAPTAPPLDGARCPGETIPDDGVCLSVSPLLDEGPDLPLQSNQHHERSGRLTRYDQIPRLPDRPADYDRYRYPVPPGIAGGHAVVSGYDLDRPDPLQRRGRTLSHVGHGGVDLPQARGTPVTLVSLEHQEGDAEVLYTGPLFGTTVVTRHTVREGGRARDYVVLFGHLDRIASGLAPGAMLRDGDLVGAVGDTGSPELVHLHLEVRRVRDDVDVARIPAGGQLLAETVTVVCDPRNVLPLLD